MGVYFWTIFPRNGLCKDTISIYRGLEGVGFRVWGFGFRVWGLGFRVWGLGSGAWDFGHVVQGEPQGRASKAK